MPQSARHEWGTPANSETAKQQQQLQKKKQIPTG
jgi:hypothetical protein